MSFLDNKLNEEKLNALSFLDCIKWIQDESNHLSYSKGSSSAYWKAKELIRYLIKRYCKENNFTSESYQDNEIGSLLFSTDKELNDYNNYDKAEAIAIFKSNMDDNTTRILHDINNKL